MVALTAEYERKKAASRNRSAIKSRQGRDIGPLPPVKDVNRKAEALRSLRVFCEKYFPNRFPLAWSDDHLRAIAKIELAITRGGKFALAMPRGSGKTTLCEVAVLWAMLTGQHLYVVLIGSSEEHALAMLTNIKAELSGNELLAEDWPEACFAIHALEGESRRCTGQLYCGTSTKIFWGADQIILPTIPGARGSGALLRVAGITGNIRGKVYTMPDGRRLRPSLVILDDPQTDESANSPAQCKRRSKVIQGAVLGLGGPKRPVAAVMPCTVIVKGDLADEYLDRKKRPQFQGERLRLVYRMPNRMDLWEEYARIRDEDVAADGDGAVATAYYAQRKAEMDEGAIVAWKERFGPNEISALQAALNWYFDDPAAFAAEGNNDPLDENERTTMMPAAEFIAERTNGFARGVVPVEADYLTGFIDVHAHALYWVVTAWTAGGRGWVVDYGTTPDQRLPYFTLSQIKTGLDKHFPGMPLEAQITHGLNACVDRLVGKEWKSAGGGVVRIDRLLIDANWGPQTTTVYDFCRAQPYAGIVMPSHGRFIGAVSTQWKQFKRKPGEKLGHHWLASKAARRDVRHCAFDTNYWKTFIANRVAAPVGQLDALTLFGGGAAGKVDHRLIADHWTAETSVAVTARNRTVDEWKQTPGKDNHWFDGIVGSAVGAAMLGMKPPTRSILEPVTLNNRQNQAAGRSGGAPATGGRKLTFAEKQALARARRG